MNEDWIPIENELPEEGVEVLICTDKKEIFIGDIWKADNGDLFYDDGNGTCYEGTPWCWMSLPEPQV